MPEQRMDDRELITLLDEHNKQAIGYLSDEVSLDQDANLDRYLGKPYGDEEEGRSNAMSMDVAEVVDWALPDLLEPFLSGDRVVEFEPSTEADEAWCDQASDLANHAFWRDNDGFIVLHDTVKTGLIQKLGLIKVLWDVEETEEEHTLTGLAAPNVDELAADPSLTIESIESEPVDGSAFKIAPEAAAAYHDGQIYTVKLKRRAKKGCNKLFSIPPEQFKVSSRSTSLETTEYCVHETEKRRSQLLAEGYDEALVAECKSEPKDEQSRADSRFDGETRIDPGRQRKNDVLILKEEYVRTDFDGSGEKLWKVIRVGNTILHKPEVMDAVPVVAWSPDRIPNRLIGLALADKVKQTQKIKTHLTRNLLDNVYLANQPRFEVPETAVGEDTIADLLTYRIGGLIRTKRGNELKPIEVPDRSGMALTAIQYMDSVREQQSGITRNGVAVQSEMLDAKSAYQSRKEDRNEQVRKRLMARMLAETLLVPVFRRLLRNIVKYQDAPRTIKLRGSWVTMDPRGWHADLRARVAVGLGYTNKQEEIEAASIVGNAQMQALQYGLVAPQHLYATFERLIKAVGWSFADKYAHNPATQEGQQAIASANQAKPDPKEAEAQAKIQIEQMKAQHGAQMTEAKLQADMREANVKAEIDKQVAVLKAESERQIAEMRIGYESRIAEQRLAAEMELAQWKAAADARIKEKAVTAKANGSGNGASGASGMAGTRFGGQIG